MSEHWAVSDRTVLRGTRRWQSDHLDPIEASKGGRGRVTLWPLSKAAEDICTVNGTDYLVYQMVDTEEAEK